MPTSSITKEFVIKDSETCDRLIHILTESKPRKKKASSKYKEGKELLEKLCSKKEFGTDPKDREASAGKKDC